MVNVPDGATRSAEQTWDQDYSKNLVANAIELMRKEFAAETWQALKLFATSNRTAQEISAETGVSTSTIYSAKSRLMKRMRQELDGFLS